MASKHKWLGYTYFNLSGDLWGYLICAIVSTNWDFTGRYPDHEIHCDWFGWMGWSNKLTCVDVVTQIIHCWRHRSQQSTCQCSHAYNYVVSTDAVFHCICRASSGNQFQLLFVDTLSRSRWPLDTLNSPTNPLQSWQDSNKTCSRNKTSSYSLGNGSLNACTRVCLYTCMRVCVHACLLVLPYGCISVCVYSCIPVGLYTCMHVCVNAGIRESFYACVRIYIYVCM